MRSIWIIALLAIFSAVSAQECLDYYPTEAGEKFTVKTYDRKDRLESLARYTVKEVGSNSVTYYAELYDEDEELLQDFTFDILCEDGKIKVDMKSMMSMEMLQKMQSEGMEMEVKSDFVEYPISNLSTGMELPDAKMSIKMNMEGMGTMMTMKSHMYDRKVEGTEEVEIEGNTYTCYKITGTTDVDMGFLSTTSKSATYVSKDAGYLKSETFNKKGKLESYSVLIHE